MSITAIGLLNSFNQLIREEKIDAAGTFLEKNKTLLKNSGLLEAEGFFEKLSSDTSPIWKNKESLDDTAELFSKSCHRLLELLFKYNVLRPASKEKLGSKLLDFAIKYNNIAVALLLLRNGVPVTLQGSDYQHLHTAVEHGHQGMAALLLEYGADINGVGAEWQGSPLIFKATNEKMAHFLMERGANIKARGGGEGQTFLHESVSNNDLSLVELAFNQGIPINAQDREGATPLHYAAKLNAQGVALFYALQYDTKDSIATLSEELIAPRESILNFLINNGADINAKDNEGQTPLHVAVRWAEKRIVCLLMEKGADVNIRNNSGKMPIECTRDESIKILLRPKPSITTSSIRDPDQTVSSGLYSVFSSIFFNGWRGYREENNNQEAHREDRCGPRNSRQQIL